MRGGREAANSTRSRREPRRRRHPWTAYRSSTPPCETASSRPGISLNAAEKLEIAHQLARLGVDVIEAGFPIASPGDFEAVQAIAREVDGPGHRRPRPRSSGRHRARVRAPSATPRDRGSTRSSPRRTSTSSTSCRPRARTSWRQARAAVAHAKSLVDDVEFSPMDATRADVEFTAEVVADRHRRGRDDDQHPRHRRLRDAAGVRGVPDAASTSWCPALRDVVLSVHCHDDLGLAVANSFAGVQAGARQVECAINGIGERAGNASLEEIVMLLHTRAADVVGVQTGRQHARDRAHVAAGLAPDRLRRAAQQGDRRAQRVRARVRHPPGRRAQGAHDLRDHGRDDGRPGGQRRSCWASTPAATRCARRWRSWASRSTAQALNTAFKRFKEIADKKKQVTAMDLEALVTDELRDEIAGYALEWFDVEASIAPPAARDGRGAHARRARAVQGSFTGDGPVDAIFRAINAATGHRRAAARVPRRRGDRRPGRARRGLASCSSSRASGRRPGRRDRHPRGGGAAPTCARCRTSAREGPAAEPATRARPAHPGAAPQRAAREAPSQPARARAPAPAA